MNGNVLCHKNYVAWLKGRQIHNNNYLSQANRYSEYLFLKPFKELNKKKKQFIIKKCLVEKKIRLKSPLAIKIRLHSKKSLC